MNKKKSNWVEEVIHSMEGSQKAQPRPEVLAKIQGKLSPLGSALVPVKQWRKYAAAAAVILLINISALMIINKNENVQVSENGNSYMPANTMINTYQIYD